MISPVSTDTPRLSPSASDQHQPADEHQPEPAQLIEDAVEEDPAGRCVGVSTPAADDDPHDGHVPRPERDAGPDPGQDQVGLEPADQPEPGDQHREDGARHDPGDDPEDRDHQVVLEGQSLERVDDLLVVDEAGHDEPEHDDQDTDDDADPDDRVAPARRLGVGDRRPRGGRIDLERGAVRRRRRRPTSPSPTRSRPIAARPGCRSRAPSSMSRPRPPTALLGVMVRAATGRAPRHGIAARRTPC